MIVGRRIKEAITGHAMMLATAFSTTLVVVIAAGLYLRARPLLASQSLTQLLFGETWMPSQGQFGLKPFIIGTAWVTITAAVIAVPLSLLTAVFLAEYAPSRVRSIVKPLIDLLAGIPSVVYGVWGLLVIVPFISEKLSPFAQSHFDRIPYLFTEYSTGFSVLAGGMVLAIMIFPVIISVTDECLRAVPSEYREAALALGATRFETVGRIVVRKAFPGIAAAVVLGISRALGETMAVLMVAGNVAMAPKSVFDACYPLPALIANNYGEVMSIPLYDSALLGSAMILLLIVLAFNLFARAAILRVNQGEHL